MLPAVATRPREWILCDGVYCRDGCGDYRQCFNSDGVLLKTVKMPNFDTSLDKAYGLGSMDTFRVRAQQCPWSPTSWSATFGACSFVRAPIFFAVLLAIFGKASCCCVSYKPSGCVFIGVGKKQKTTAPSPSTRTTHVAQREAPLALNASRNVDANDVTPRRHHAAPPRPRARARGGLVRRRPLPRALRLAASGE
jgi:hypothetical protein